MFGIKDFLLEPLINLIHFVYPNVHMLVFLRQRGVFLPPVLELILEEFLELANLFLKLLHGILRFHQASPV